MEDLGKMLSEEIPTHQSQTGQNLSIAHAMATNEVNIQNWFKEYVQVVKNWGIVSPEEIWSGDETGYRTYPKKASFLVK